MAEDLVPVQLRSSIASPDAVLAAGTILSVRADVAAAWIADGLAIPVERTGHDAAPETAMRAPGRARLFTKRSP